MQDGMFGPFDGAIRRILRLFPAYRALEADLAASRRTLETTAADRDRISRTFGEELAKYRCAFETTAADRDRISHSLGEELAKYRYAFETTAADRNRLALKLWSLADPLDPGHFRLDRTPLFGPQRDPGVDELWRTWQATFDRGEYDRTLQSIFKSLPVRIAQHGQLEYYRPFAAYYLASILAAREDFKRAVPYVEMIDFDAPADGADLLPYDLRQSGRLARCRQDIAIEHGRPGALVVSLMRSASATLTNSIAATFDIPHLRMCIGEGLRSIVVKRWAVQVARGGTVTHEHFRATPENLAALRDAGIRALWVQVRDPRDAAFSLAQMREDYSRMLPPEVDPLSDETFVEDCQRLANWIGEWIDARDRDDVNAHFITFAEVTSNLAGTIAKIFPGYESSNVVLRQTNFRRGIGGEWRVHSPASQERAWSVIPTNVKAILKLEK
jgi:hypothetical protein